MESLSQIIGFASAVVTALAINHLFQKNKKSGEGLQGTQASDQSKFKLFSQNYLENELQFQQEANIEKIAHLHQLLSKPMPKLINPMLGTGHDRSVTGSEGFLPEESFVNEAEFIVSRAHFNNMDEFFNLSDTKLYVRAGPRKNIYFDPKRCKVAILNAGGLCPGLNVVIRELVMTLWFNYGIREIYGIIGGFSGFYTNEPIKLTPQIVVNIHNEGGTIIKSARGKTEVGRIVDIIEQKKFNLIFGIGGDGTHKGLHVVGEEIIRRKLPVAIAGIPKTIDNDVQVIDRTFGYLTAVNEAVRAINAAKVEAYSQPAGAGMVKLMGRHSGFIAMQASTSSLNVNVCLIPENKYELHGPNGVLEYIAKKLKQKDRVVIVIAEGCASGMVDEELQSQGTDASGNAILPDIGNFLKKKIIKHCQDQGIDIQLKYIDPTYMIRGIAAIASDKVLCAQLAQAAVHGTMAGFTNFTVGTVGNRVVMLPIPYITQLGQKRVDIHGEEYRKMCECTGQPNFRNKQQVQKKNLSSRLVIDQLTNQISGKRVLMRVDFNVPLANGKVKDATRIRESIPTIQFCLNNGAKSVVLISHLGRPNGKVNPKDSLKPVHAELEQLLNLKVTFLSDCASEETLKACQNPVMGSVFLLENLRYYIEEEGSCTNETGEKIVADKAKVEQFRQKLTQLGDLFVNDAFGTAHRAHSSMVGVNLKSAAGLLMKKEIQYFAKVLESPAQPFVVIMGGSKISDKIQLIYNLLDKCNEMIIGGGMSYTFLKVLNNANIGKSLFDEPGSKIVPDIMKKAQEKGVKIHLPIDHRCGSKFDKDCEVKEGDEIPEGWMGLDIGPKTAKAWAQVILNSKTICWNGPAGVFEFPNFEAGSFEILQAVAKATSNGAISIIGGGDTASFVMSKPHFSGKISHISTGGGASLELLEGKELPGVQALSFMEE